MRLGGGRRRGRAWRLQLFGIQRERVRLGAESSPPPPHVTALATGVSCVRHFCGLPIGSVIGLAPSFRAGQDDRCRMSASSEAVRSCPWVTTPPPPLRASCLPCPAAARGRPQPAKTWAQLWSLANLARVPRMRGPSPCEDGANLEAFVAARAQGVRVGPPLALFATANGGGYGEWRSYTAAHDQPPRSIY